MVGVDVEDEDDIERALSKFRREVKKSGVIEEYIDNMFYTKESKKKREARKKAKQKIKRNTRNNRRYV